MANYKASADKKQHSVEFEEGDFVWVVLKKDMFHVGEFNKLIVRKNERLDYWRLFRCE